MNLRNERFGSRKDWCAYVNLTTTLHRQEVAQVDEFLALLRARLAQTNELIARVAPRRR